MEDQLMIIHRDIRGLHIALDENWGAKIIDLKVSLFLPPNQVDESLHLGFMAQSPSSPYHIDPEYRRTFKLKRESDVYSFGVILFEVLCGRFAGDELYLNDSNQGLAFVARRCLQDETLLMEMIDPILKEEGGENSFIINGGSNKYSLEIFVKIAQNCIAETQDKRPTMAVVISEILKALLFAESNNAYPTYEVLINKFNDISFEKKEGLKLYSEIEAPSLDMVQGLKEVEKSMELKLRNANLIKKLEHLKIPLSDIMLATENFSWAHRMGNTLNYDSYVVELEHFDEEKNPSIKEEGKNEGERPARKCSTVHIKRIIQGIDNIEEMFYREIEMLATCKHPSIAKLLGFCDEGNEMIIIIEELSNGHLYNHWIYPTYIRRGLTWEKRLKICLDVANALNYLHNEMEDGQRVLHGDIESGNIMLDENWGAKIVQFMRSVFLPPNQDGEPPYDNYALDVLCFGLVMLEVLCGRPVLDPISDELELLFVARRCFQEGTVTEMIDPILMKENDENTFSLKRGPNKSSLEKFVKVAHQCISETQDQRPAMKVVVKELEEALLFQENDMDDDPIVSLHDIQQATQNFHDENCIGGGGFGKVYKGKVPQGDGYNTIVAKRLDTRLGQGEQQFRNEIQILFEYKHDNIIPLVGYCDENNEQIIVYEYMSRRSLDKYLKNACLTWMKRLNICIDVANALAFLHGGARKQAIVIHRDIKTANILLNDKWDAKLADFGLSLISPINQETDYVIDHVCGTRGYLDPLYLKSGFLTKESDIYSFGVVLFEILGGKSTFEIREQNAQFLAGFVKESFEKGKHDDLVFEALKEQIVPKALTAFQTIAYRCLHDDREKRPTAKEVLKQLNDALEFQELAHVQPRLETTKKYSRSMSCYF